MIPPHVFLHEKAEQYDVFRDAISIGAITFYFLGLLRSGIVLDAEGTSNVEGAATNVISLLFDGIGGSVKTRREYGVASKLRCRCECSSSGKRGPRLRRKGQL